MLVFFAALLSTASAADICCSPDQWQADVGLVMGSSSVNGKNSYLEGTMHMSYDAVHKLIAYDQMLYADTYNVSQRVVADFQNGVMYTVRDGMCNKSSSGDWIPFCVPDNATMLAKNSVQGFGANSLNFNAYNIKMNGYNTNIAITNDTCVPITETFTGNLPAEYGDPSTEIMEVLSFSNIKAGIDKRDVFFIPAQCASQPMTGMPVGRRSLYHI